MVVHPLVLLLSLPCLVSASAMYEGSGTVYSLSSPFSGNCNFMHAPEAATTKYAALNAQQWEETMNCGRCAEVSCTDPTCSGRPSEIVYILDQCPGCGYGGLDLSPEVFESITGQSYTILPIQWKFVDCPVSNNVEYCLKTGSSESWVAVQPTNLVSGVKSMTINNQKTSRVDSAFYFLIDGHGESVANLDSVKISMTSVNGEVLQDTLSMTPDKCTTGSSQFTSSGDSEQTTTMSAPATPLSTTFTESITTAPATEAPNTYTPTMAPVTTVPSTEGPTNAPLTQSPTSEPSANISSLVLVQQVTTAPITETPTTEAPITEAPITETPITETPTTTAPTTEAPITEAPIIEAPISEAPISEAPTSEAPMSEASTTEAQITEPISGAPTTEAPTTDAPISEAPTTEAPMTETPTTEAPMFETPTTRAPITETPISEAPISEAPITETPISVAPITEAPTSPPPTESPTPIQEVPTMTPAIETLSLILETQPPTNTSQDVSKAPSSSTPGTSDNHVESANEPSTLQDAPLSQQSPPPAHTVAPSKTPVNEASVQDQSADTSLGSTTLIIGLVAACLVVGVVVAVSVALHKKRKLLQDSKGDDHRVSDDSLETNYAHVFTPKSNVQLFV